MKTLQPTVTLVRDWIPLIQTCVWPVFISILCICFRKELKQIVADASKRFKDDDVEIGLSGVKLTRVKPGYEINDSQITNSNSVEGKENLIIEETQDAENFFSKETDDIYLLHSFKRAPDLDKDGMKYFRLSFTIDCDDLKALDRVKWVTYFLHPTFKNPIRVVDDRQTNFRLDTAAWGEFLLKAKVHFADGTFLELKRYVNLWIVK